jgi:hypothetical protein
MRLELTGSVCASNAHLGRDHSDAERGFGKALNSADRVTTAEIILSTHHDKPMKFKDKIQRIAVLYQLDFAVFWCVRN